MKARFGNIKIGEKFEKRSPNSGLAISIYGPVQITTYQKKSGTQAVCVAQDGFGNQRMIGGHYKFGYNSLIEMI